MSSIRRRQWPNWRPDTRSKYQVHPSQIQAWKKALTAGAAGVFSDGQEQKASSDAALIARLYQEIGQLKVERDFLSERSGP